MEKLLFCRLENTSTRNAFWEGWVQKSGHGFSFHFRWGGMGSNGQHKSKYFSSKWSAQSALNDKVFEKLNRGYVNVTPAIPNPKPVEAKPVEAKPVVLPKPVKPEPEPEPFLDGFDFFEAILG